MEGANLADGNLLSDKMKINLHMLGALMLNGVGGEVHGAKVATVDKGCTETAGSGVRGAAVAAKWPQSRRWQRHDTRPQRWSGRQQSTAWLTRKPSCPP
jgi:hypothetical protein